MTFKEVLNYLVYCHCLGVCLVFFNASTEVLSVCFKCQRCLQEHDATVDVTRKRNESKYTCPLRVCSLIRVISFYLGLVVQW